MGLVRVVGDCTALISTVMLFCYPTGIATALNCSVGDIVMVNLIYDVSA